jgi:hypothetical protein
LIGENVQAVNGEEAATFWNELHTWHLLTHAYGKTREQIFESKYTESQYDLPAWIEAGCPQDIADFRRPQPVSFEFGLSAENAKNLRAALEVWDYDLKSFSMLVKRVHNSWQIRSYHEVAAPARQKVPSPV